jgi:hypothetical protein
MGHDCVWVDGKTGKRVNCDDSDDESDWNIGSQCFKYSAYWHASDAHGHTGETILKQLTRALKILEEQGFKPDPHAKVLTEGAFMVPLMDLMEQCKKNLTNRFYSDNVSEVTKCTIAELGYESDGREWNEFTEQYE